MADNKTRPTSVPVEDFLEGVGERRREDALTIMGVMRSITGEEPVMWGSGIIGFGSSHYAYNSGREGDVPRLGFSPRNASLVIYFNEGLNRYGEELARLGMYKTSISCLYITKLSNINLAALEEMLTRSFVQSATPHVTPATLGGYLVNIPIRARPHFEELRQLVTKLLPDANEVLSYGIVGYRVDGMHPKVFISGWKDHAAICPVPQDEALRTKLKPYIRGKGTLWFGLDTPLPITLIDATVRALSTA